MLLCNSERFPWLKNFANDTKPDFFVMSAFFVKLTDDKRWCGENDPRVYATPAPVPAANANFLGEVKFIWEGKICSLTDTELGKMLGYMVALSAMGHRNPRGVLYNQEEWYYFEFQNPELSTDESLLIRGKWTDAGSALFLSQRVESAPSGPLTRAVLRVSSLLRAKVALVGGTAFLGNGREGFVFKVTTVDDETAADSSEDPEKRRNLLPADGVDVDVDGRPEGRRKGQRAADVGSMYYAMKIVLGDSIKSEFEKMTNLSGLLPDLVCTPHGNLVFDEELNCGAYLMPVGRPITITKGTASSMFEKLVGLHKHGVSHGDPRLPNILDFGRENGGWKWIDCRRIQGGVGYTATGILSDLRILLLSLWVSCGKSEEQFNKFISYEIVKNQLVKYAKDPNLAHAIDCWAYLNSLS